MVNNLITKEDRPISSLVIDSNQRVHDHLPTVGRNGITRIEAYNEFGENDYVIWFALYAGDRIVRRVNGKFVVEIGYATDIRN